VCLRRQAKVFDLDAGQRCSKDPDAVKPRFSITRCDSRPDNGKFFGRYAHHTAGNHIHGHRVLTCDHHSDLPRFAAAGTVPFHTDDRVHNSQARLEQGTELDEHEGKKLVIHPGIEMPLDLALAGNAPEEVLDRPGERRHAVGLELREIDDRIGLGCRPGDLEALEPAVIPDMHDLVQLYQCRAFLIHDIKDAGLLAHLPELSHARAVADHCRAARFPDKPDDCPDDLGMGGNGRLRRTRLQQVRLDEHPLAGPHEGVHPSQQVNCLLDRGKGQLTVIFGTAHDGDRG
jgi:hypothetical protein